MPKFACPPLRAWKRSAFFVALAVVISPEARTICVRQYDPKEFQTGATDLKLSYIVTHKTFASSVKRIATANDQAARANTGSTASDNSKIVRVKYGIYFSPFSARLYRSRTFRVDSNGFQKAQIYRDAFLDIACPSPWHVTTTSHSELTFLATGGESSDDARDLSSISRCDDAPWRQLCCQ
jgi:hypothetical protein